MAAVRFGPILRIQEELHGVMKFAVLADVDNDNDIVFINSRTSSAAAGRIADKATANEF